MENLCYWEVEMGLIRVEKDNVLNLNSKDLAKRFDFYFSQSRSYLIERHTQFCEHQIWGRSDLSKATVWNVQWHNLTEKN